MDYHNQYISNTYENKDRNYKFIAPQNDDDDYACRILNPIKFYQIATYPLPNSNKYNIRITEINSNNEPLRYKEIFVERKVYKQVIDNMPINKYRLYAVYNLSKIGLPDINDIMTARSCLL